MILSLCSIISVMYVHQYADLTFQSRNQTHFKSVTYSQVTKRWFSILFTHIEQSTMMNSNFGVLSFKYIKYQGDLLTRKLDMTNMEASGVINN